MNRPLTLSFYFFATFLQAGTYGLTFLLPLLFQEFRADEKDVGNVLMATTIATLVTVYFLSHVTALLGRINTIGLSSVFISASLFLFGYLSTIGPGLYIAGILLGIGWAMFYVLTPVVLTEITEKSDRVRIFTLLSVFIMAGFGLSPVFGNYLVKAGYSINITFILFSVLCIISGVIFIGLRRAFAMLSLDHSANVDSGLDWISIKAILCSRAARPIIMVGLGASVFAAVTNFQTIYAQQNGLDYANYFFAYTATVIICRILFAEFIGGQAPYGIIALLLAIMVTSVLIFILFTDSAFLYILGAILFGIGYGVSYPIVKAMAANDSEPELMSKTMQIFGFSYFIGVFGFPFIAGWIITSKGIPFLLVVAVGVSALECILAAQRYFRDRRQDKAISTI